MRKFLKNSVKIFLGLFLIIINPFTIFLYEKVRLFFSSLIVAVKTRGNPFNITSYTVPVMCGGKYVKVKGKLCIGRRCRIECFDKYEGKKYTPKLTFGDDVVLGDDCHVGCINEITIGDGVLIGSKVLITDHAHGRETDFAIPRKRELCSKGAVTVGKNCWIGENVAILPGVSLGENCVVGANSVVTKSFGDGCVIAGNPAKEIKRIAGGENL